MNATDDLRRPATDGYPADDGSGISLALNNSMKLILDTFMDDLLAYKEPMVIVLLCIYTPIILVAFFGNLMVLLVIFANKQMRNVTNYLLVNLAIADLLVTLVCTPFTVAEIVYKVWLFGEFSCKATAYLQGVSIAASVLTIMALSLDRFLAIRHPVKARRLSTTTSVKATIIAIWLFAAAVMLPLAIIREITSYALPDSRQLHFCHEHWPSPRYRKAFDIVLFFFIYVIPGGAISLSYVSTTQQLLATNQLLGGRRAGDGQARAGDGGQPGRVQATRRRVAKMLLVIAILFAVSWMPYHILVLYNDFHPDLHADSAGIVALSFALALGHSHSAQNPVIYCMMRAHFNGAVRSMLSCTRSTGTPSHLQAVRFGEGMPPRAPPDVERANKRRVKCTLRECSPEGARARDAAPWQRAGEYVAMSERNASKRALDVHAA